MSTFIVQPAVTAPDKTGSRIPTLDGWRGVAILLVLVDHIAQRTRFERQIWANFGTFGVYIFFVISGYIITTRLIEERQITSTISLSAFYLRRAFRILPIVVVYVAFLYLLSRSIGLKEFQPREIAGSLFFFRNYQFAAHPGGLYTAHFWSLSVEEHFYLLWPALLLWSGNRRALGLALSLATGCSLWRMYNIAHPVGFLPGGTIFHRSMRTDLMIDGLFIGSALALLILYPSFRYFISRNMKREGMPFVGFLFF
jgi:peptidoglycan/LPS O-acetylase OafA/YrhL